MAWRVVATQWRVAALGGMGGGVAWLSLDYAGVAAGLAGMEKGGAEPMSGPNTITIQVDNSGALMAIREVTGAVQALAEQARTTQVAITALTRAASGQTSSARPAAAAPAQAANPNDEARKKEIAEANKQAEGLQRLIAIHKLEADGSAKARVALVELAKARDLANLAAEQEKEMAAAQAGQIGAIAEHYAILRAAVEETATAQAEAAQKGLAEAEASKKQLETITKGWSDALLAEIMGKTGSMKKAIKDLFKQIAAEAIKSRVIVPISGLVTSIAGAAGISSLLGTATPAAAGGAPGSTSILDSLTGGLDKIVGGLEKGFGKLGETLFGLPGKRGTATEGLFGRAGELFGSTDLAQGVTGALGGAGLGATAAGLLGALGIGKGNTKGGAIGGAIGGAAGSIFGPLGTTVGSLLGGAIGSLFGGKPSNKEGSATIDLNSGNVAVGGFTGKKFSQENRDQASGIANQVLSIKSALEKGFGARITGTLAVGAGDRDGLFATAINSSARTKFKDDKEGAQQLLAYVTGQFVTAIRDQLSPAMSAALGRVDFKDMEKALGDLDFISNFEDSLSALGEGMGVVNKVTREAKAEVDTQIQALKDFKEKTARLFPDDVDRASTAMRVYVEELVGITDAAEPMSQVETALMALQARFEAYKPLLEEVGYTAEQAQTAIANGLQKAKDKLKDEFNNTQTRTLREATGQGYLNQVDDLKKGLDTGLRDAAAVGGDAGLVRQSVTAQLQALLGNGNLDKAQLQGVIDLFGNGFPEAAAVARDAMQGLIDRTGEIARMNQGFADRLFAATNDTATKAGALAAFDRQATAERLEIAKKAGADLATYDQAVAAERLRIEKDFADRLAATNLSIQDRLFAATNDTATETGALAALNRQVARERLELAKVTGTDLVAFDAAVAAERTRIQQEFADRQAAEQQAANERLTAANQSIQDRLFAATTDTATEAGALAALNRQAARERLELEKITGADLISFDQAVAAERLRIEKDFADRLVATNLSIQDRLFAATTDTSTQAGALAALNRKAAQERLELAKIDGADLISFDRAVAAERLRVEKDFADRLAATNLSIQDRLFAATTDTSTKAGALAAFDRQVTRERLELTKVAGADLISFDRAVAAERLRIEQDFAQRLAATNLSIQDRLFAASTDTATLTGALAAFDRKVAQERTELARTTGVDLISFDRATSLERLAIQRQFAEQVAAIDRGFADRLFNATNDASTLTGALAAFDRDAAREREEAAKNAGVNLALLEQALGAERARIIKDFNDRSIEEAQAKADQARDTLIAAYEREADAARSLAASWKQAGDGIRAALTGDQLSDQYSGLNPEQRAKLAEDELRRLAARANDASLSADERLAAAQALPEARRAFLDAVRPLYEGTERWGAALDLSAQLLDNVALAATREVDIAQQQVDLAQQQLTALGVVNQSVLTVAQALADYQAAQAQVAAARAAAQAPVPTPASPAGVPANANQPALTREKLKADLGVVALAGGTQFGTETIQQYQGPNGRKLSLFKSDLDSRPVEYLSEMARQLGLAGYQQGGLVGNGIRGVDSVLARYQEGGFIGLAGGEFVTRATSVTPDTLPLLRAINDSGRPPPSLSGIPDTGRLERLLQDLLVQTSSGDRTLTEVNARGYEALITRLEGLLSQGQEQAADRRRAAR